MRRNHDGVDGLAEFVALRGSALRRLAWLLTADRAAAEDLVQEALVRVIPQWSRIPPEAREAYLRRVIRSAWIDGWRRQGRFALVAHDDLHELADEPRDDESIEGLGDRAALAAALAQLAPGQRAVLVLRFYEDQTQAQTAAALGCSAGTVKSQTREALRRLRLLVPPMTTEVPR